MNQSGSVGNDRPSVVWGTAVAVWLLCAFGVWAWMTQYAGTGSLVTNTPAIATWPSESLLVLAADRPTLLLFLHPRCPCSSAVLHELDHVISGGELVPEQRPQITLVATVPTTASADWFDSSTIRFAQQLPNLKTHWDTGGSESERFQVTTSGTIRLYHQDGRQLFSGGITVARGHEGASVGSDALLAILKQPSRPAMASTPVFGCPLCIEADPQSICKASAPSDQIGYKLGVQP